MLGMQTTFGSTLCDQIGFEVGLSSREGFYFLGWFHLPVLAKPVFNRVFKVLSNLAR
jgi:hypothetical protein